MTFADIFTGKTATAEVFFLIAVILFALDAIVKLAARPERYFGVLIPAGLAFVALGWLVL